MTGVWRQLVETVAMVREFDLNARPSSRGCGERLSAYAFLYVKPDINSLKELVQSVTRIEDKPFGQYWGLKAAGRVLEGSDISAIDKSVLNR
jgi:hypothetical protein